MSIIFFLIGCSILLALGFLCAFLWANKTGQHNDTYTPAIRILFDNEKEEVVRDIDGKVEAGDDGNAECK
ncbi:cbb3-type cytochrome oxidase assembly protein CcoS [Sphingobacterium sp. UT-1RO-CII-1]|uniref:cbb3-type cytochrome oxidase assembly protein CcoS n=1 Tax=Sphingobacterium sp. UT-1RO-CII-1 TaxID=2995225 RepID=UPI00227A26EC|nr:cbb3-type cytochrome oxidase assembly protein CcoS [Sphingobacterium sp. UT-1RO-CII-1]MCY4780326.1 cbb3-type cytochrome oxidase assembly protein CcoS [Sphingobacterium sp. UT-1RO-CII-1]